MEEPQLEPQLSDTAPLHIDFAKAGSSLEKKMEKEKRDGVYDEDEGQLAIDVYQTDGEIVIESTVAGAKKEDLDIMVTPDSVTIKGKRERQNKTGDEDYFYQECYWGRFARSVILPQEIDPEKATSTFKNGVLVIRLPKLKRGEAKKLKVHFD